MKIFSSSESGSYPTAPSLFEYDSFGHLTRQTLALAEEPTPANSPITEMAYGVETTDEGVFSCTTQTRYNATGGLLVSVQKQLISQLSPSLAEKVISIDERGLTSADWVVYNNGTKRTRYSSVPTSDITATRPLTLRKDGTWFAYGWDLTKNICEIFGPAGYIRTAYTYSPYGEVTSTGDVTQPIQWSSEYNDAELALGYYNYRHYNATDGRWMGRDRIQFADGYNSYVYCLNDSVALPDVLGNSRESKEANRINARRRQQVGKTLNQIKRSFQNIDNIANQRTSIYYSPNVALPSLGNAVAEVNNLLQNATHRRAYNELMEREARALSECHRAAELHFRNSTSNSCKQYCCRLEYLKIYGGNESIGFYILDIRVASVFMVGKCSQGGNYGGIGPKNSEHYSIKKEYNYVL